MPPKKCTDEAVLFQRRQARRAKGRLRTRLYRERIKAAVDKALDGLLAGTTDPNPLPALTADKQDQIPALAKRTAQTILRSSLLRHSITIDRCVSKVDEGLKAQKLRQVGNEILSRPDFAQQLRSNEQALRLLGLTGEIPHDRRSATSTAITINVQNINLDVAGLPLMLDAEKASDEKHEE